MTCGIKEDVYKPSSVIYGVNQTRWRQDRIGKWMKKCQRYVCSLCLLAPRCQNSSAAIGNVSSITGWRDCAVGNGFLYLSRLRKWRQGEFLWDRKPPAFPTRFPEVTANFTRLQYYESLHWGNEAGSLLIMVLCIVRRRLWMQFQKSRHDKE